VLAHLKDFLAEPRPEPPCDPDYLQAAVAYFRIMNLFGLPVYEDDARNEEVAAVRAQMEDLFKEVADRCLRQFNLYINIDVIWTDSLEKNYNGVVNLGWQVMGDDSSYVYGTAELPHEKSLSLSLRGLSSTVVTIESFEEGTAITTTTLEHITAPLEQ